jgi:hypothetical protein
LAKISNEISLFVLTKFEIFFISRVTSSSLLANLASNLASTFAVDSESAILDKIMFMKEFI